MRIVRALCGVSLLVGGGCRDQPTLPGGYTAREASAFQRRHGADVSAPTGPLSTVASHYVGPGEALVLGVVDGALVEDPPGEGARVRIEVDEAGARCTEGCGAGVVALGQPQEVSLDRFTLGLSPQSGTLRVLVHDPEAPGLRTFEGLSWYPIDDGSIVAARFTADPERPTVELSTSRGLTKPFVRAGTLSARIGEDDVTLVGYQAGPQGRLLVPLTDATTGVTTYPVGRYLEVDAPVDGVAALDFNRATNPWCAYSEHYNCPIPPTENALPFAVTAGEQVYAGGH